MSDPANPLKTYHQRQIDDQATPVRLYGENGGPATIQLSGSKPLQDALVTVGAATAPLDSPPVGATSARIEVKAHDIAFRVTGQAPVGQQATDAFQGDTIYLDHPDEIAGFRAVRAGDSDAALHVIYFGGN